jgi:hypothetical protein
MTLDHIVVLLLGIAVTWVGVTYPRRLEGMRALVAKRSEKRARAYDHWGFRAASTIIVVGGVAMMVAGVVMLLGDIS